MNILEPGGFSILVVNARHIKNVPGHKTDKKDSAWICKQLTEIGVCMEVSPRTAQQTTRRGLARDQERIGRTNPKADFYWDFEPEYETGLND